MRSRVSTIIMLISIVLLTLAMVKGIEIGNFKIMSISQLKEKNNTLTKKIEEASVITSKNYLENEENLNKTFSKYTTQKNKYEKLVGTSKEESEQKYETKQYDISYLWRILGKYAANRNLYLGIDVTKNESAKNNTYNFKCTLEGDISQYGNISQFITDIENDSDLYFRIYNFKMTSFKHPKEENKWCMRATFEIKNINIDSSTIK